MSTIEIKNKYVNFLVGIVIFILLLNANKISTLYYKYQGFEGIILKKDIYISGGQHPYLVVKQKNNTNNYNIGNLDIYAIIDSGDYIVKKKGDLNYILIHKNDTIKFKQ